MRLNSVNRALKYIFVLIWKSQMGDLWMSGRAAHPRKKDFYVYKFGVEKYPFYVGLGRDQRGPDRLRYVRSLSSLPHFFPYLLDPVCW